MSKSGGLASLLLKFASVGVLATAVHALIYLLALESLSQPPQLANLAGYLVALFVSYFGQRRWTFSHVDNTPSLATPLRFFATSLVGYGLNALWVFLVSQVLQWPAHYALIGIVLITPASLFLLMRYWVFVGSADNTAAN